MRSFCSLIPCLVSLLVAPALAAEKVTIDDGRFSLEIPADWKKGNAPEDGNIFYRVAPGGNGTFSIYKLDVAEGHRANLKGTLEGRVKAIAKAGFNVTDDIEGKEQDFDGKEAVFAVIPVEIDSDDAKVEFRYYLVLLDAKDTVIIMQAALPHPLPEKIRESTLEIIQSFREKE